ncbi:MAG: phosphoribosylanthranilate isomerase [Deltaproteobacteria bacterium]|nr:phosphoribosylanthranilate isomerase [Deltaproteobacteria bacterium]
MIGRSPRPVIQVAGIRTPEEARMVAEAGATHVGFPLCLDVHAEDLPLKDVRAIVQDLPSFTTPVVITYLDRAVDILSLVHDTDADWVQLHGPVPVLELEKLIPSRTAGTLTVIKSLIIGPRTANMDREIAALAPLVDWFITDTYDPATGASGATGKTHDWDVSRRIVEISPRPVILAGGLNPDNILLAVETISPQGVDAHTGLEDERGFKDKKKVRAFVDKARQALARCRTSGISGSGP